MEVRFRAAGQSWATDPSEATLVDGPQAGAVRGFFSELKAKNGLDRGAPAILGEALGRYLREVWGLFPVAGLVLVPGLLVAGALFAVIDGGLGLAILRIDQMGSLSSTGAIAGGLFYVFWLHGLVLPLGTGAVALVMVDRLFGARRPLRVYRLFLWMALPRLLMVLVPLGVFAAVGYFFFAVPGLAVSYFFSLLPIVALIEDKGGLAAMERSFWMVRAAALRVASILLATVLLLSLSNKMADSLASSMSAPVSQVFLGHLIGLPFLPVPMVAALLVYLDLRRGEPEEAVPFDREVTALRAKFARLSEVKGAIFEEGP